MRLTVETAVRVARVRTEASMLTEDWQLRTEDWQLKTEDWKLQTEVLSN